MLVSSLIALLSAVTIPCWSPNAQAQIVAPTPAPTTTPSPPPVRHPPAPDSDRTAALIGSSIAFGVGGAATGVIYALEFSADENKCSTSDIRVCSHPSARASLVAYGAIVTVVPSLPRFVVGDVARGLLFSALRGISVVAAEFAPWGTDSDTRWQGPFLLGFAAPVAIAIVDLATTPHREEIDQTSAAHASTMAYDRPKLASGEARIISFGPLPVSDGRNGIHGTLFTLGGVF